MGKKKSEKKAETQNTNFNNASTYGWQATPDTADTTALRNWQPQVDPGLASQYGNARNKLNSSFLDPLGGYATAGMQDAQKRTNLRNLGQDESQAFRSGQYDVNQQKAGQLGTLASLTAPRLTQVGSSGAGNMTGNSTMTQSDGGAGVLNGVLSIAGPLLM